MGLSSYLQKRKRTAFTKKADQLARSLQLEIHRWALEKLSPDLGMDVGGKVARLIGDYVFANPPEGESQEILDLFEEHLPRILSGFGDTFKTNATGVLIMVGAARQIDLDSFKGHMANLAELGFTKLGADTPNVRNDLLEDDIYYLYAAAAELPAGDKPLE